MQAAQVKIAYTVEREEAISLDGALVAVRSLTACLKALYPV